MAGGDLVSQDFQYELRTTLVGASTDYELDHDRRGAYTPLGIVSVKSRDVDLASGDGSYAGADRKGPRIFVLPLVYGGTPEACGAAIQSMETMWAAATSDVLLYGRIPGVTKFYAQGRPRGLGVDASDLHFGIVRFTATFVALTPALATQTARTVTNKALTSNVATLTTSVAHGFVAGREVVVSGVDATFDGTYTISTVPTSTTFTYAKTAANVASTPATGTATSWV